MEEKKTLLSKISVLKEKRKTKTLSWSQSYEIFTSVFYRKKLWKKNTLAIFVVFYEEFLQEIMSREIYSKSFVALFFFIVLTLAKGFIESALGSRNC